jgi:hypothetical protein
MAWSKHRTRSRTPDAVAALEAVDPTTDADVLRRAAEDLRRPHLCDWDPEVAHALADLFDARANIVGADRPHVVAVAHAFMARMEDQ